MTPDDTKSLIDGTIVSGATGSISATKLRTVLKAVIDTMVTALTFKADTDSPTFTGTVSVPLAPLADDTAKAASTSFVARAIAAATTGVALFNSRSGNVTLLSSDVTGALGYTPPDANNAALTGNPTAPSQADGNSTTRIATTAFVQTAIGLLKGAVSSTYDTLAKIETALGLKAPLANPTFTGTVTVPTASPGDNTTKAASTAFVAAAVTGSVAGVASFNGRTGTVTPTSGDVTGALGYTPANVNSPALTGAPTAPLAADGDATSKIANTTFVQNAIVLIKGGVSSTYDTLFKIAAALALKADIASPTFSGVPAVPTATADTNTTQAASTGFVIGQKGTSSPLAGGTAAAGSSLKWAPINHVHPFSVALTGGITGSYNVSTGLLSLDVASGGGGGVCFPAGSMVQMADGTWREITEVQGGDRVMTVEGSALVTRLHITKLGRRRLYAFGEDASMKWSEEHAFWTKRGDRQWLWTMNASMLEAEAEKGEIGGLAGGDTYWQGSQGEPEKFAHVDGWVDRTPIRSPDEGPDMALYLPMTAEGELIIVNGYLVGSDIDGNRCDYRAIVWQQ